MILKKLCLLAFAIVILAGAVQAQSNTDQIINVRGYVDRSELPQGSDFKLAVVLDIAPDYHIGAADKAAYWPAKIELKPVLGISFNSPDYPTAKMKSFSFTSGEKLPVYDGKTIIFVDGQVAKDAKQGPIAIKGSFSYQACTDDQCLQPQQVNFHVPIKIVVAGETTTPINNDIFGATDVPKEKNQAGSLFGNGLVLGLLAVFWIGVGLSFTPCVYPMIPVTVGYFGTQTGKKTRRLMFLAALYVLGLATTYSAMGVIAARTGKALGSALQSPYVPIVIATVLVALALSLFGLYEFKVPASIASRSQDKRGPLGALFMGLLFGLVCAPCVGPFTVALLVYVGKTGNPILGFATFFVLAVGMGVPFFILATFSGSINKLPRAGLWMVTVKKIFGMLLIGAAIYYLTPVISRFISERVAELALPLFIVLAGIYLAVFEKTLHQHKVSHVIRHTTGFGAIILAAWLALPVLMPSHKAETVVFAPYTEKAIIEAARLNKPVMIDFSADWCAACKELEHQTFPDRQVIEESKRFVVLRADQTDASSTDAKLRQQKYAIKGLPTIVFIDSKGVELKAARVVGFIKPNELVKTMRKVQ